MNAENSRLPTRWRIASAVPSGSERLTLVAGPRRCCKGSQSWGQIIKEVGIPGPDLDGYLLLLQFWLRSPVRPRPKPGERAAPSQVRTAHGHPRTPGVCPGGRVRSCSAPYGARRATAQPRSSLVHNNRPHQHDAAAAGPVRADVGIAAGRRGPVGAPLAGTIETAVYPRSEPGVVVSPGGVSGFA